MNDVEKINKKYEDLAYKTFPFIDCNRVIILEKGFYKKSKATYRGISFIFDDMYNRYKALLLGYYYVPDNYIIVSDSVIINEGKQSVINKYLKLNYILINKAPSLKPFEFEEDSEEYKIAKISHLNYINNKNNDTFNN